MFEPYFPIALANNPSGAQRRVRLPLDGLGGSTSAATGRARDWVVLCARWIYFPVTFTPAALRLFYAHSHFSRRGSPGALWGIAFIAIRRFPSSVGRKQ